MHFSIIKYLVLLITFASVSSCTVSRFSDGPPVFVGSDAGGSTSDGLLPDFNSNAPGFICGNGTCDEHENTTNCIADCPICGDQVCSFVESHLTCPADCKPGDNPPGSAVCGDAKCDLSETAETCPTDCSLQVLPDDEPFCGDSICSNGENAETCPGDCAVLGVPDEPFCGDSLCSDGETAQTCPGDCAVLGVPDEPFCGDNLCSNGESSATCPDDCGTVAPPPPPTPPNPNHEVKGFIGGVFEKANGWGVQGWACHYGWGGSVEVDLYVGNSPANSTYLKTYLAADSQEVAVGTACGTQEGQHRFFIPISDNELNQYAGKNVYIYGISPIGKSDKTLTHSGSHNFPGTSSDPNLNCQQCLGQASSCEQACQGIGYSSGFCKFPGSTDSSVCCECNNSNPPPPPPPPPEQNCQQCLGQASSCEQACQGIGYSSGFCKFPGSTDPGACCECNNSNQPPPGPGPGPIGGNTPFNLNEVTWLHVNVSSWPETTNLNVSFQGGTICLDYGAKNTWPPNQIPHNSGEYMIDVVANPWVFIQHNGQWYAGTWEWLTPGSTCKNKSSVAGDHIKQAPFGPMNWTPTSGETLYFMVSGLARFSNVSNVQERSNIVQVVWP